jgi:hypothetical protein
METKIRDLQLKLIQKCSNVDSIISTLLYMHHVAQYEKVGRLQCRQLLVVLHASEECQCQYRSPACITIPSSP